MSELLQILGLLSRYRRNGRKSAAQLQALQRENLVALLTHARRHSPYYRQALAHIDLESFHLHDLPVLDKATMMARFDEIVCDPALRRDEVERFVLDPANDGLKYKGYVLIRTSGTSGRQAMVAYDQRAFNHVKAVNLARSSFVDSSPRRVLQRLFMPGPLKMACVLLEGGFHPSFSNFHHQPRAARLFLEVEKISLRLPVPEIVARLNAYQPQVLFAYPSILEALVSEKHAGRLDILRHERARIVSLSEPLSVSLRRRVEDAFGVPLLDVYGAGECLPIARSCLHSTALHVNSDMVIYEVADAQGRPVPAGQFGDRVLVTNLFNYVQPIIRYEVNDIAAMLDEPCACGSPLPRILAIKGRSDELLWLPGPGGELRALHPYFLLEAVQKFEAVLDWRVEQLQPALVRLDLVLDPLVRLEEVPIVAAFQQEFANVQPSRPIELQVRLLDRIEPDGISGKVKRVSSHVRAPS